jgi:hypothetical protein
VLTLPPTIVAGMVSTIDSIAPFSFYIKTESGWTEAECTQIGLWPGKEHYECHYEYSAGYVAVEGSVDNQNIEAQGPLFLDGGLQAESSPCSDPVDRLGRTE